MPITIPFPANIDYKNLSVAVPGTKRPGQTAHYRNAIFGLLTLDSPGAYQTLLDIFNDSLREKRNQKFLGHRPVVTKKPLKYGDYVWQTYAEVDVRRRRIGSALHTLFHKRVLSGENGLDTVGIWDKNRPEWQIVDLAVQAYKKVSVSLYDSFGPDSVDYIINHAHLSVMFTALSHIPLLLKLHLKIPMLKLIVCFDPINPEAKTALSTWCETLGIRLMEFSEFEAFGEANLIEPIPTTSDQIVTICYTSGTTSLPKGALLTHGNLASSAFAVNHGKAYPDLVVAMSYLPLAHIYERAVSMAVICAGGAIGYSTGDPLRLLEDTQALQPHLFASVPRILNKIYQAAMTAGDVPGLKGAIFRTAVHAKLQRLHATGIDTHPLWDRLVFRKIRAVLGNNILLVPCGSAPINAEVIDFLRIALYCDVTEGEHYGLTENCAVCTNNVSGDPRSSGTIGCPQASCEVKLVDVPSMNYMTDDKPYPRGELCMRGANAFIGYYKNEKATKETIIDGWVHTGDVATIDECGRFKIIDRIKNIMKLAQGEYVALEKVENMYSTCPVLQQIYVHGDSLQSYLIATVVADPIQLAALASRVLGSAVSAEDTQTLTGLLENSKVVDAIQELLNEEAKKNHLNGIEIVKRIHVTLDPFSVEDGSLTPTLKLKRKEAYQKHKAKLDALYALGEQSTSIKPSTKL